jgi:D-sedoheptulose 7-phosphate isomerase
VDLLEHTKLSFLESIDVKKKVIENHLQDITNIAVAIVDVIKNGGTLFLCGNGGSLADAQHLAAELLVRLRSSVNRKSLPALCLATDMSSVTACGNDYSFEDIFSRSLEGLGKKGDAVLGISTSGKSKNVFKAFEKAKQMDIKTLGFLGCDGGSVLELSDLSFIVPSYNTARIQESHITAGHVVMEIIEEILIKDRYIENFSKK